MLSTSVISKVHVRELKPLVYILDASWSQMNNKNTNLINNKDLAAVIYRWTESELNLTEQNLNETVLCIQESLDKRSGKFANIH